MNILQRIIVPAIVIGGMAVSPAALSKCPMGSAVFAQPPATTVDFHDYEIRLYGNPDDCDAEPETPISGIEILKAGKRVYAQAGYSFAIGYALEQDQPADSLKPVVGMDFTGEGKPGLLVSEWSGGAHCCYTFHLFQLGETFKKIQSIQLRDADESSFVRREGVKGLVLNSYDYSAFAYFPFDFAGSPAGRVLLSYQGGSFKLDSAHMKANAPAADEIDHCGRLFKKSRGWKDQDQPQPLGMWYYATDLIYTGNAAEAWTFLDAAWGGSATDKKKYLDDYRKRLTKSLYYRELMDLQKAPTSATNQKIDWTKQCYEYMHG